MLFIVFTIGGSRYALDASDIERVIPLLQIRPVPRSNDAVVGICNFHGDAIPVIDLNRLAGHEPAKRVLSTRMLVVRRASKRIALLVEDATETLRADPARFSPAVDSKASASARWLGGLAAEKSGFIQRIEIAPLIEAIKEIA